MTDFKYGHKIDCNGFKDYTIGVKLGSGAFGVCYEVFNDNAKKFAVKFISKADIKTEEQLNSMNNEISIHKSLKHKNIVNFISSFDYLDNLAILMEICSNNSLKHLLKRRNVVTEPEARYFTRQIASACQYMHSMKVIHRDLKTENIFLDDKMIIKVADFGLSAQCNGSLRTYCGTPVYMAPEMYTYSGYSYSVDMWALGCITYVLLIGNIPFTFETREALANNIMHNLYNIPLHISEGATEVIHKLLSDNATDRPSVETLLSMNFYKDYTPNCLPLSALVTTPRFPDDVLNKKSYTTIRNTIIGGPNSISTETTKTHLFNLQRKIKNLLLNGIILPDDSDIQSCDLMANSECPALLPVFWVTKWTITATYGLGYKLNDNSTGVVLTNGTKMIVIGDNDKVQCIDKDDNELFFNINSIPETMVTNTHIVKLFQKHLNNNLAVTGEEMIKKDTDAMSHLPYVDAYIRTKKSLLLLLSSGVMQMNVLSDHTKLILCPVMEAVTFVDAQFRTFSMDRLQLNGLTQTMYDRLRYALDMIESVMNVGDIRGDISCICDN